MSGNTTKGIPYATGADSVSQGDLLTKALAEKVDVLLDTKVRKLLAETVNNSTALQNDDHLFFPVVAGNSYEFEMFLVFTSGSSAIDAKVALTFPVGTCTWGVIGLDPAAGAGSVGQGAFGGIVAAASGASISVGVSAGVTVARIQGTYICTTTGTLRLQWAQNTLTAADLTLAAGSLLKWGPL